MKRFFLISLVVMTLVACLAVPSFASTIYSGTFDETEYCFYMDALPEPGSYSLEAVIDVNGEMKRLSYESVEFVYSEDSLYCNADLVVDGILFSGGFYINRDQLSVVYFYEDGYDEGAFIVCEMTLTPEGMVVPSRGSVTAPVFAIFGSIGAWCAAQLGNLAALFYVPGTGLTFLGVLSVAGLGIGVVIMVIAIVARFLRFRG